MAKYTIQNELTTSKTDARVAKTKTMLRVSIVVTAPNVVSLLVFTTTIAAHARLVNWCLSSMIGPHAEDNLQHKIFEIWN